MPPHHPGQRISQIEGILSQLAGRRSRHRNTKDSGVACVSKTSGVKVENTDLGKAKVCCAGCSLLVEKETGNVAPEIVQEGIADGPCPSDRSSPVIRLKRDVLNRSDAAA